MSQLDVTSVCGDQTTAAVTEILETPVALPRLGLDVSARRHPPQDARCWFAWCNRHWRGRWVGGAQGYAQEGTRFVRWFNVLLRCGSAAGCNALFSAYGIALLVVLTCACVLFCRGMFRVGCRFSGKLILWDSVDGKEGG
jgi:hypothetical protein